IMVIQGGYDAREILLMSMGLVVSAIPEGLPAALTVTLALGMNRMARRNVIIRRLIAVEALGSCTYICSDKTGTLTVNELTVRRAVLPDGTVYTVGGEGLDLGGDIEGGPLGRLHDLLLTAVCANEGHLAEHDGRIVHSGDMVDVALLVLAEKAGFRSEHLQEENATVALMPYEPERAWAGSINTVRGESRLFVKGSGERIAEMCERMRADDGSEAPFDAEEMEQLSLALARQGYRVIALASGPAEGLEQVPEAPQALVFEGFLGMIDPLRPEAAEAIRRCRSASIEVAMITGDHPETARHIALELGLIDAEAEVVTGKALREATARDAADPLIRSSHVFARIEPDQKRQIVESLIRDGHFVAVTGDGVNDAPALRHANAGVAMGKRGSDVARETSDLIITDDNFASILAGVEEGRVVYNNIRKVIALLISTGASAILLFFLSALSGLPPPLTAVQLLWLNLVANGVQDVALGFEPAEGDELDRPPRRPGERIFERRLLEHVAVNGIIMGVAAYLTFGHFLGLGEDVESARNLTLMLMVLFGNVHVLNTRSETRSIFAIPLARNPVLISSVIFAQAVHIGAMYTPVLSGVLDLQPIDFDAWLQLLAVASILIVADELLKLRHRRAGI
ncbi:MAG: HAD-IC family P-type ATPase, partial [Rhodovibrionaceae bacterium]|nr:HAD-IC family P-type ATPase [Rhodovibrionaceae bacterium]